VLAEAAELAPFGKLLYSSDAFGLPELYYLGALTFRRALGALLAERIGAGEWSAPDAARIARLIGHRNAEAVYALD
jgi:predicted TIM-barrel fold metal-dependent hydrolase